MLTAAILVPLLCWLIFLGLLALTIRACAQDAIKRGKSPLLVSIIVIFFFPLGAIAWLLFRPDPVEGPGAGKSFRLNDYRLQ